MHKIIAAVVLLSMLLPLSGCFAIAVGAAGAGAGYIYKDQQDKDQHRY